MDRQAYTIPEFCDAFGISRATFYELEKAGKGPRTMMIGTAVRIRVKSAEEWARQREAEAMKHRKDRRSRRPEEA